MAYTNTGPKKGFSVQGWDLAHYKRTESYTKAVDRLYNQAISEFARMAVRVKVDVDKPFSFDAYPSTRVTAAKITNGLAAKMKAVIQTGAAEQWLYASKKGDAFLASIMDTSKVSKKTLSKYQDRNLEALSTFQGRKVNGMGLSDRIWKQSEQFKKTMELGIDVGLGEGRSAQALSKDLRQNLLDPDRLFRRVRDKNGALQLSQAAKDFHPGQGVYRSSYKNAMRLTRSEINMAYRESDNSRFGKLGFVVGFEVKLSNNHTLNGKPFTDICDSLAGKYPKDFVYKGWHPQCRCFSVPILQDPDEFDTDELNELKAALNGTEYKQYVSKNTIAGVPENFKKWMAGNQEKVDGYKSPPYFIKDNFKNGKIADGLKFDKAAVPQKGPVLPLPGEVAKVVTNNSKIERKLKIIQGEEMSFEEANELKGNINFNTSPSYKVNCQSCVVSNELRRRGFDVTAKANLQRKGNIPYELSRKTEMVWLDPKTGGMPIKQKLGGSEYANGRVTTKTVKMLSSELVDATKETGRYHIDFGWKKSRQGHIVTLEKLENGKIRIYDPQNGKLVSWSDLSQQISPTTGARILRVDNLQVNTDIIDGVVTTL